MATVVILGALTRTGHLEGPLLHDQVTVAKRYMVDDVQASIDSYTKHLGFEHQRRPCLRRHHQRKPAGAAQRPDQFRGSSHFRRRQTGPGGWNRIHFIVEDFGAEVERLRRAGLEFRNDVVTGPGGSQILLQDPSGNLVELFQPAGT